MSVIKCTVPAASALDKRLIQSAYFQDSYRAPVTHLNASIVELFFALFGHHPLWVKLLLVVRNKIAILCGLEAPTTSEIMKVATQGTYRVGDTIGVWPIFMLSESELIAGRDNKHLDFRLSLLRETNEHGASITVTTICNTHNTAGKIYLFFISAFHKWGVQRMIANAITGGRL